MSPDEEPRMSESSPRLRAVEPREQDDVPTPDRAEEPPVAERRRRSLLPWLLGALLVVAAVGWAVEAQRRADLADALDGVRADLTATRAELGEARDTLRAYDARLADVRERTGSLAAEASGLAGRLTELERLVAAPPGAAEPTAGMAPEDAAAPVDRESARRGRPDAPPGAPPANAPTGESTAPVGEGGAAGVPAPAEETPPAP